MTRAKFKRGDQVEICCDEEGFENAYFPATIITEINNEEEEDVYIIQFNTLLGPDEHFPLREFRTRSELRPVPPELSKIGFKPSTVVDAYANDGWWKGTVLNSGGRRRGRKSNNYYNNRNNNDDDYYYDVGFERDGVRVEIGKYSISQLRVHQDWVDGDWIVSSN